MRKLLATLSAVVFSGLIAYAAVPLIPNSPTYSEPSQIIGTLNYLIGTINSNVSFALFQSAETPRNVLDNGAMAVQQRGTGAATCGTTSGPLVVGYSADRWGCDVNVTSGVGTATIITTSPAPPTGFAASVKYVRASGVLTQPVCAIQEITTADSLPLAGKNVTFSFQAAALAGLAADNSNVINGWIITGTGTDEGLSTMTAAPAVTPAWTGLASVTQAFTITTSFATYQMSSAIPATATEVGVLLCFTPTASGAGATDGFAVTGMQLEIGNTASSFEFRKYADELRRAQYWYVQWLDTLANTFTLPGTCTETTSGTTAACILQLPTTMRTTPTVAVATATSFGMTKVADGTAEACSTLATVASSGTPNNIKLTCAASETAAVGTMHIMLYANSGAGKTLTVSADF